MTSDPAPVPGPRPEKPPTAPAGPPAPAGVPYGALQDLIRSQTGTRRGDATAYLRAAAHLNPAYRDAVVEELAENPHRIPPPSFGVDLVAILKECFANRRWAVIRALVMLVIPFLFIPVDRTGAIAPLAVVLYVRFYLFLTRRLTRLLERFAARLSDRVAAVWVRRASSLVWLAGIGWIVVINGSYLVGLWGEGFLSSQPDCHYATAPDGGYGAYSCNDVTTFNSTPLAVLLTLAGWAAVAGYDRYRRLHILHRLATGSAPVAADGDGAHGERYRELRAQQSDPDVVYSDFAPFVGAGVEVDHWSFPVELVPLAGPDGDGAGSGGAGSGGSGGPLAKRPKPPTGFTTAELHAHIRTELLRLGAVGPGPAYPGDRLHGIRVDDYVFKRGMRVGPSTDWSGSGPASAFAQLEPFAKPLAAQLFGLPAGSPPPSSWWADSLDLAAEEQLRHYLAARVESWNGEVVLTVFTRVQVQGGLLFLENRAFLLPPIDRAYHAIDLVRPPTGVGDWIALAGRSLLATVPLASSALPDLYVAVRTAVRTARARSWYDWMCRKDQPVDHGPRCSARELGAESEYHQLFQEMDAHRFLQSIETRTLTAVRGFLREHGYRTDAYEAHLTTVVNNGIQVNGNVNGVVQSGANARASYQQVATPQARIGTQGN